jgi:hypothetical protein
MLDEKQIAEIVERNPQIDASAIERSREAARRLARLGFKESGYRLEPPLGGGLLRNEQGEHRVRHDNAEG